ncbi:MAG: PEGA domain-containing protein [Candidatus Eremiobacteraeota bacterium]|nr:PEGA domain-containing protein [Candidatus Eremiobacteraeota bacterium]
MLLELRNENARKQALVAAVGAASRALEKQDFHGGMEALQSVRRAYGDSEEISHVISEYEARRTAIANEHVGKSVEAARAALLASDSASALKALQGAAAIVEFAGPGQQADWGRLRTEAGKPTGRRTTGNIRLQDEAAGFEVRPRSRRPIIIVTGGALIVIVPLMLVFLLTRIPKSTVKPPTPAVASAPAPTPTGTLKVRGNLADVDVFVDGVLKGFTQSDGTLALPLDAGAHTVRFTKAGYDDLETPAVTVSASQELNLPFSLKPGTGPAQAAGPETYLTLKSTPGALVTIDKAPAGRIDGQGGLIASVKPGKRSVQISLDNYQTFNQTVNVKAGEKRPVNAALVAMALKPAATSPTAAASAPAALPTAQPVQVLSFSAAPSSLEEGQATTLQWTTSNASEVSIDNGIDIVALNGHTPPISPNTTTTYTLTAKGPGGTLQKSVTVAVTKKAVLAATPPQPATAEASPRPADESAALRAAVGRYQAAYNSHQIDQIRAAWPTLPSGLEKAMRDSFKDHPEIKVNIDCPSSPNVSGDTARWACRLTTTLMSGGKPSSSSSNVPFTFARRDGNWVISSLK